MNTIQNDRVFKKGSTTYFYSSQFFPLDIKNDVSALYRFVREADDLVDNIPQKKEEFFQFRDETYSALLEKEANNETIIQFRQLYRKYDFDISTVKAFLSSMESDLGSVNCITLSDTQSYMYGSAEVIGLFMSKILKLPSESYLHAQLLGKSMQYANFIRDIKEDLSLNRNYLPRIEQEEFNLTSLEYDDVKKRPEQFINFIKKQINHYRFWQQEAEHGFKFIPLRYRIPIQTASDMYKWTINSIEKDPMIVYQHKVKPKRARIILRILVNLFKAKNYA